MKKPWKRGYDDGFDDRVFGIEPKVKKVSDGPFSSIFEMEIKQAYDKGYLAGYKAGEKEGFLNKSKRDTLGDFKAGYFNGFQDKVQGKPPETKEKTKKPSKVACIDSDSEAAYRRGYIIGYQRGA